MSRERKDSTAEPAGFGMLGRARATLMFFLYGLAFSLGVIIVAPFYLWRYRRAAFLRDSWRERLGYLPAHFCQPERGAVWVHAVSVGETLAVSGLVQALHQQYPGRKIFISHATPTGREIGEKTLPEVAGRFYLPLDWDRCVRRALNSIKPGLLLIVETELWPHLIRAAHQSGARIALVNARLSDRSFPGYRLFRLFMRRVLANVDRVFTQTPRDAERFCAIGAVVSRVISAGNLKFDAQPAEDALFPTLLKRSLELAGRQPVLVAASTMPGEEELVLRAWQGIQRACPPGLLILAPRHPARFEAVAQLLATHRANFLRRTALPEAVTELPRALASPAILLLDSLGELAGVLQVAEAVFVGGSLVPTGGHNLLEAAQWGKPVIFGPHMQNFRDAAELFLRAGAAIRVRGWEELAPEATRLFQDKERCRAMGAAGRQVVQQGSGATERILDGLAGLLDGDGQAPQGNRVLQPSTSRTV